MSAPTAVIAEDEPALRAALRAHLARLWPELAIAGEAADGVEALHVIDRVRPQLAFLDIEMPGMTGLDLVRRLAHRCHVVFVTAYEAHAIAAFEAGAIDYVLKPYELARLATTVARVQDRLHEEPRALDGLLADLARALPPREHLRWINAPDRDSVRLIAVDDVLYFQADRGYTRVVTADGESLIQRSLKDLTDALDPAAFWPIHRSTIVNASAIASVSRDLRGRVTLRLKTRPERLPVSEAHEHLFRRM